MNTSALITRLLHLAARPFVLLLGFLKKVALAVFGRVQWSPPRWLSQGRAVFSRFNRAHPLIAASGRLAILLLFCGGAWTWHWYQHRPKPCDVRVKIEPISVTKLEKDLTFPTLDLRFSYSAARLEDLKKTSVPGVRLDPPLAGKWMWANDQHLFFKPAEDWPADQKFKIIFDKKFFPPHVLVERFVYEFTTPPFEIAIKDLQLYQDPSDPTQRQITATLELTHAVEPGELERHLQLLMIGGSTIFPPNDPAPHFALTYGLHKRIAYLRSSNVTLPEDKEDFLKLKLSKGVRTAQGGAETREAREQKLRIPSTGTAFQIDSIAATIARTKNGEPEQVLVLTTTADISGSELGKAIQIRLLPKREAEKTKETESESSDSETADQGNSNNENTRSANSEEDESDETTQSEGSKWQSPTDVPDDILEQAKRI